MAPDREELVARLCEDAAKLFGGVRLEASHSAEGGMSLVSTAPIAPGTEVLKLPERLLLFTPTLQAMPQLRPVWASLQLLHHSADLDADQRALWDVADKDLVFLVVALQHLRFAAPADIAPVPEALSLSDCMCPYTFWAAYTRHAFPADFSVPFYMDSATVDALEDTAVRKAAVMRGTQLQALHSICFPFLAERHPLLFPDGASAYDAFLWATVCVDSRAFKLLRQGQPTTMLAPLADMLNHAPDCLVDSKKFDDAARQLVLTSSRECGAGDPVTISYGDHGNAELLLYYGFCIPNNPFDSVEVDLALPDEAAESDLPGGDAWLPHLGLSASVSLTPLDPLPSTLLQTLWLLLLPPDNPAAHLMQSASPSDDSAVRAVRKAMEEEACLVDGNGSVHEAVEGILSALEGPVQAGVGKLDHAGEHTVVHTAVRHYLDGQLDVLRKARTALRAACEQPSTSHKRKADVLACGQQSLS